MRFSAALRLMIAFALALIVARISTVTAQEAGIDSSQQFRARKHQDTGGFDSTVLIQDDSAFAEFRPKPFWLLRIEGVEEAYRLKGTGDSTLIALHMEKILPRLDYQDDSLRVQAVASVIELQRKSSIYGAESGSNGQQIVLPGLNLTFKGSPLDYVTGGWREMDIFALPFLQYTPVIYETFYAGAIYHVTANQDVGSRLSHTQRVYPSNLPLARWDPEVSYTLRNPLQEIGEEPVWREVTVRYLYWSFTTARADSAFLSVENTFRFQGLGASHAVTHRLTVATSITEYRSGALPRSIEEDYPIKTDLQQLLQYTIYGQFGTSGLYWRFIARLDDSLAQHAYMERRYSAGLSLNF
jgi:hypothetical protein